MLSRRQHPRMGSRGCVAFSLWFGAAVGAGHFPAKAAAGESCTAMVSDLVTGRSSALVGWNDRSGVSDCCCCPRGVVCSWCPGAFAHRILCLRGCGPAGVTFTAMPDSTALRPVPAAGPKGGRFCYRGEGISGKETSGFRGLPREPANAVAVKALRRTTIESHDVFARWPAPRSRQMLSPEQSPRSLRQFDAGVAEWEFTSHATGRQPRSPRPKAAFQGFFL
jgi:hypothetical protein